jgi:hypothetical protein
VGEGDGRTFAVVHALRRRHFLVAEDRGHVATRHEVLALALEQHAADFLIALHLIEHVAQNRDHVEVKGIELVWAIERDRRQRARHVEKRIFIDR